MIKLDSKTTVSYCAQFKACAVWSNISPVVQSKYCMSANRESSSGRHSALSDSHSKSYESNYFRICVVVNKIHFLGLFTREMDSNWLPHWLPRFNAEQYCSAVQLSCNFTILWTTNTCLTEGKGSIKLLLAFIEYTLWIKRFV